MLLRDAAEFPEDAFTALRNVLELLYTNHFRVCLPAMSEAAVAADAQGADVQTRALLEEVGLASALHRRCLRDWRTRAPSITRSSYRRCCAFGTSRRRRCRRWRGSWRTRTSTACWDWRRA